MEQLELFVPVLCRNAAPQASPEAGGGPSEALQALRAHIAMVVRLSLSTDHLDAIEGAALANLTAPAATAGPADATTAHGVAGALMRDLGDAMQVRCCSL